MQQLDLFAPVNTRRAAHNDIKHREGSLKAKCLNVLKIFGPRTADEIAAIMNETVLSIRPRVADLARVHAIADTGIRRENDSGKLATVWRAK